jgi:hypothetical protein
MTDIRTEDCVVLAAFNALPTTDKDGIVLILYGEDADGEKTEIAAVIMDRKGAGQLADALLDARLQLDTEPTESP